MGNAVILQFLCPLVGYHFLSLRHVFAHVPLPGSYCWRIVDAGASSSSIPGNGVRKIA
jgi:hypothetical protein